MELSGGIESHQARGSQWCFCSPSDSTTLLKLIMHVMFSSIQHVCVVSKSPTWNLRSCFWNVLRWFWRNREYNCIFCCCGESSTIKERRNCLEGRWKQIRADKWASSVGYPGSASQIGWGAQTSAGSSEQRRCCAVSKAASRGGPGIWSGCLPGAFLWRFSRHVPLVGPRVDPEHAGEMIICLIWPAMPRDPQEELENW